MIELKEGDILYSTDRRGNSVYYHFVIVNNKTKSGKYRVNVLESEYYEYQSNLSDDNYTKSAIRPKIIDGKYIKSHEKSYLINLDDEVDGDVVTEPYFYHNDRKYNTFYIYDRYEPNIVYSDYRDNFD